MTYFMRTERLGFRRWTQGDAGLALQLWGDADVTRLIGGPFSNDKILERLAREILEESMHGVQYWPIFLLENDAHVGCCGLRPYRLEARIYELGFHLRAAYWGMGLAFEAASAAIDHAFEVLGAAELFAGHNPANAASRHLLTKLGFHYTHDEFFAPTGLEHPSYRLAAGDDWARLG